MLFSIIVPIYNVEKYLHPCIDSVLAQTCPDFELILVDDGSEDNCAEIIDAYAASDSRTIAIHKRNGGLVSARKAGLAAASGEYIVVLDGDDWIAENTLECIAKMLEKNPVDMVCFGHHIASEQGCTAVSLAARETLYNRKDIENKLLPTLLLGNKASGVTTNLWGKAFKWELYQTFQQQVEDRITMGEDGMVVYPCFCAAESVCFLPDLLYYYRTNPESMTRSCKKQIPWEEALLRIAHLKKMLPLEKYGMQKQLGCYAAHTIFNVILTQINHREYAEVKKEAQERLSSGELTELIRNAGYAGSLPEKLAQFALRYKWIWLIKLYSMIR